MNTVANGGFPEPPHDEPARVVRAGHDACGAQTEIRLPASLPAEIVQRVVCSGCGLAYANASVMDVTSAAPAGRRARGRPGRTVAAASAVLAAGAVVAALLLIQDRAGEPSGETQEAAADALGVGGTNGAPAGEAVAPDAGAGEGGGEAPARESGGNGAGDGASEGEPAGGGDGGAGGGSAGGSESNGTGSESASDNAELVQEQNFAVAIPPGWARSNPPRGATFAADAGADADATLWVERNSQLSIRKFEKQSLKRLKRVARNVRVESRTPSPTDTGTVVRLKGDARSGRRGRIKYEVTLRAAGPFRYYLVTSIQPDASGTARRGVRLVHGSFIPAPTDASKGNE